jgi:hypothetical protein
MNGSSEETGAEPDAAGTGPGHFGLIWAVKPSFVSYVLRMPDGKAYIGSGVEVNKDNELLFPFDEEAAENLSGTDQADSTFCFRGDVVFQAHFGMLDVRISRPQLHLRGADGELTVNDPESAEGGRLPLVTFTAAGPRVKDGAQYWTADDVRLTAAGVPVFGDVYPADEPFAPLMIAVPRR